MTRVLLVGIKVHDKIYSQAFTIPQLLLASTKVHDRSYSQVFSTHQYLLASSVFLVLHKPTRELSSNFLEA